GGRIVKDTGDGFLATFDAATPAVRAATALQHRLVAAASRFPPERRILFRIALNLCDVIVEAGDVYGDGVNIAARLQAFVEPGDIAVTAPLAESATEELAALDTFAMGTLHFKHIGRPVPAMGIRIGSLRNVAGPATLPTDDPRPSIAVLPFR